MELYAIVYIPNEYYQYCFCYFVVPARAHAGEVGTPWAPSGRYNSVPCTRDDGDDVDAEELGGAAADAWDPTYPDMIF